MRRGQLTHIRQDRGEIGRIISILHALQAIPLNATALFAILQGQEAGELGVDTLIQEVNPLGVVLLVLLLLQADAKGKVQHATA